MQTFPRTMIEDLSVSRLVIGTNWFLGFSHTSAAQDKMIKNDVTVDRVVDILGVFLAAGIDTVVGLSERPKLQEAVARAQDRHGAEIRMISTPALPLDDWGGVERILDAEARRNVKVCMPHQSTTDALVDRTTHTIREGDRICRMIRERGMIPGLSTHMPESIIYADESGLDVGTYIQLYNALGFLMQIEVEWVHRIIHEAQKPVLTIKPLAAGRTTPLVGLAFAWSTIRDCDMVAVGTMTPDEAREVIDTSWSLLSRNRLDVELQRTRSKESVERRAH